MAQFKADERDVLFNLFEYLQIGNLTQLETFKEQSEDLYKMVVNEALKFALNEIDPIHVSGDREGCKLENGTVVIPQGFKQAYDAYAQNGFIGVDVPQTYGGQNLPVSIFTAINEFFSGADVSFTMYGGLTRGSAFLIESFGSEDLKKLFCEKMYNGTWAGTMCLTEPWAGTAVGDLRSTAKPNADGTYNITGNKIFISGGDQNITENIIHLVLARVEGDAPGTKGISLFVVPKIWVNADGSIAGKNDVNCVNVEHKMGIKGQATCSLNFGEAGQCRGFLVGERSKGMRYMFQMMNEARLLCGILGMAVGSTAYLNALNYSKERTQGGSTVIIDYPDVRRNLMLCRSLVEGMRALILKTAMQVDLAHKSGDPAVREKNMDRIELMTPICKAYCTDFGFKVTELAIQIYGGYGYINEYPVEQYMRDIKIASLYEGTNGVQALDLLGRKLPMKGGQAFRDYYEEVTAFAAQNESHADLAHEVSEFKKAADTVGQTAMQLAQWGASGEQNLSMLGATPFLEMTGHVVVAHCLLEQAVLAADKIKQGSTDVFYKNKITTAKFFVNEFLPQVRARSKSITAGSKAALEIVF